MLSKIYNFCYDGKLREMYLLTKESGMGESQLDKARLQALMDDQGLNDRSLGELAGLSKGTIYALRTGKHKSTSPGNLRRIAEALGTTDDYLLTGGDVDDGRIEMRLPESLRQLALIANRLSEVRQDELLHIAATLEQLERERTTYAVPVQTMDVLLSLAEKLGAGDVLIELRALIPPDDGADNRP